MSLSYFGNAKGGLNHGGAGKGPWIMADMVSGCGEFERLVRCTRRLPCFYWLAMLASY